MTTRAVGPAKGWDWLMRAVHLGSQNAKALFGAAALLMLIALVMPMNASTQIHCGIDGKAEARYAAPISQIAIGKNR